MLSCGDLERSDNPYIESIVEPCVSQDHQELKAKFDYLWVRVCVCEREKFNSFEITVIILTHIRNVNHLFKKDLQNA